MSKWQKDKIAALTESLTELQAAYDRLVGDYGHLQAESCNCTHSGGDCDEFIPSLGELLNIGDY